MEQRTLDRKRYFDIMQKQRDSIYDATVRWLCISATIKNLKIKRYVAGTTNNKINLRNCNPHAIHLRLAVDRHANIWQTIRKTNTF